MKKKRNDFPFIKGIRKILLIMRLITFFILVSAVQLSANGYSQGTSFTITMENVTFETVMSHIKKNSDYYFLYKNSDITTVNNLNIDVSSVSIEEILIDCLQNTDLTFSVDDNLILIKKSEALAKLEIAEEIVPMTIGIKGNVTDEEGSPLPGATIVEKGTLNGTITDFEGNYSFTVSGANSIIQVSYIGFETQEIEVDAKTLINFVLKPSSSSLDEVIVTGYFKKKKDSYTGTAVTVTAKELKQFGNANLIQSLQVFDPSFKIAPNNDFGSDPNKMPEITIRGKASFPDISESAIKRNQNMPTFILDGFEVNVEKIYDLDMNRVESVTILKDAAATAIYGSRASNGVVVVETKTPEAGKLQITYNFDATISAADLSDYNLMNAAEKLEVERLAGYYKNVGGEKNIYYLDNYYQQKLFEVKQGVNTDWISQPLEVLFGQKHSLYLEGGDDKLRYGLDVGYNISNGVMKGSGRDRTSIGLKLMYRYKNIKFKNHLSVGYVKSTESPYGSFRQYTKLNPYFRLKDENGRYLQLLNKNDNLRYSRRSTDGEFNEQFSPLYDAVYLNNKNESSYLNVTNNFSIDWSLTSALRLRANISVAKQYDNTEIFRSPESMEFYNYTGDDIFLKGSYSINDAKLTTLDANVVLSYNKEVDKHMFNGVVGWNIKETNLNSEGYTAVGFMNDRLSHISFAKQFQKYSSPDGYEELTRLAGMFSNFGYSFDNRFLVDFSARMDGSSKFGKLQRSAPFWAVGIGWNLHNENFFKTNDKINSLRLTANIGTTGSVEFDAYQALTTYKYISDDRYYNYAAAMIKGIGNKDLKWQRTLNRNIGFEATLFNNRFQLKANYYVNTTNDLLTDMTVAPSIGFDSFKSNVGKVENKGFEANLNLSLIKNEGSSFYVNVFANVRHNENKILEISGYLKDYNDRIIKMLNEEKDRENIYDTRNKAPEDLKAANPYLEFQEGKSLTAIYAVRSLGIDPIIGKEVFLKRDGKTRTYEWDAADRVEVGDSAPDFEGYLGANIDYKGFSLNLSFNYQLGGQIYNSTLIDRVENTDLHYNADKRVLEERWKNPGDLSFYKRINKSDNYTRASSRFVEDEDMLALNSVRFSYTLSNKTVKKLGLSNLKCSAYMNDVFRISTVKQERGLFYPFARTFSFSIQANF
jgi:TonB-linked SusC/RagA family outer membrane protein